MSRKALMAFLLGGCGGGDLPGQYFQVSLKGEDNGCTGSGTGYNEQLEYRVVFEGNDLTMAIEDDVFATGTVEGCLLSYLSLVWSDYRDGKEIQWQIVGSARVDVGGGDGCVAAAGDDWDGTEEFVIITSEHESVQPGCTYTLGLDGQWLREVE